MKGTVLKGDGFFLAGDGTMTAQSDNLAAIFTPRSVAVVGASSSPEKLGFQILKNIRDAGFKGPIHPVNPKATSILDLRCFPSIADVDGAPELAVIIVPAGTVPATLAACGGKGGEGGLGSRGGR